MTDRERSRALIDVFLRGCNGEKLLVWPNSTADTVAAKARELFGPTAEERAVIRCAARVRDAWTGRRANHDANCAGCTDCALWEAVDAYLASLKPVPRYTVSRSKPGDGCAIDYSDGQRGYTVGSFMAREDAQRIADLLNAAEEGK